jgi:23S rRNA pseudouridine1911/1915/1917 synthase
MPPQVFTVDESLANQTLAAGLRRWLPGQSWTQVRKLIAGRRVKLNGELWLDDVRRLKTGDEIEILSSAEKVNSHLDQLVLRHVDEHLVVVEKPAGLPTVRHPAEREWLADRRFKVPTLDDLVLHQLGAELPTQKHIPRPKLRIVHRLDKETSGLVVFARTVVAERGLGSQFAQHTVVRRYLALVAGDFPSMTLRSFLIRDRGDGRRGSSRNSDEGKEAITHVEVAEKLPGFTLLSCRLETGRTHQIRIHLAERGAPVAGEMVYDRPPHGEPRPDESGSPRLFLHATELGFVHPVTNETLHWEMPLPTELREVLDRLRIANPSPPKRGEGRSAR